MVLPNIPGFTQNGNTYTQDNNIAQATWNRVDFGVLTENVIIDGNSKTITLNMNGLDGLFSGGGQVTTNNQDVVTQEFTLEIKNMKLIINGNAKCGFLLAQGTAKFTNCHLTMNGNLTDSGGGLTYVGDNTTSSFKTVSISNCTAVINGNIGTNSGPLSGYMANGNFINISYSYTIVNGDLAANAGGFVGAYNGANRRATINGCYCIISSNMNEYSGVLSGSYFGSNGSVSIASTYLVCNIKSVPNTNVPCYISYFRTNLIPQITINTLGVWDISSKNLNATDSNYNLTTYQGVGSYNNFNTNILVNLSATYYENLTDSFKLTYNNSTLVVDYQLRSLKNVIDYNWILNDGKLFNVDTTLLLQFNISSGQTNVQIPINPYNGNNSSAYIDWGDSTAIVGPVNSATLKTYNLVDSKIIIIAITGTIQQFGMTTNVSWTSSNKLMRVISFGNVGLTSLSNAFNGASILTEVPNILPNTPIVNTSGTFTGATNFNQNISNWDVSSVTNMSSMFNGATSFNQVLSNWNTSSVTNMSSMFNGATSFNQSINNWNTSSVTNMSSMFNGATSFNQVLSNWNVVLIPSEPAQFSTNSPLNSSYKPIWGTSGLVFTTFYLSPLEVREGDIYSGSFTSDSNQPVSYSIIFEASNYLYIYDNKVISRIPFDYNIFKTYQFIIQGISRGKVINKEFILRIIDIPQPPSDITITNNKIPENASLGTFVGRLETIDPDQYDYFKYSFVSGEGGEDNSLFLLQISDIFTNTIFNYNQKRVYSIRVSSTDSFGYSIQRIIKLNIVLPIANGMNLSALLNTVKIIKLNGTSVSGQPLIYEIVSQPKYGTISRVNNGIYNYLALENKIDNFQYIVKEGSMLSLIGKVIINNFSQNDVDNISKNQGTFIFDQIFFDGNTWTFGTMRTENFYQLIDFNTLGNWRFKKSI